MRLASVAQHASHHLEKHLDKTAVECVMWRLADADDHESLDDHNHETTEEDERKCLQP